MIIVVSTDDKKLKTVAENLSKTQSAVYGSCYQAWGGTAIPQLGVNENLFVTAHGAYEGDDNNPVIGDGKKAHYVNAVDFYNNIKSIFPQNYAGAVYISACEAADHSDEDFSFAEAFRNQIDVHHNVRVFGQKGSVGYTIPLPSSSQWVEATI
ncbi:hypothetical protein JZ785_25645 [Alicyclobacillus curvatus]|nr:hypothetical protein JZ785_25645 [Alicyclobacillus curvatus]